MIQAALFDLDGTLVDSEAQTDAAIREVMAARGVDARLPPDETRGRSWADIVASLHRRYGVPEAGLAEALLATWAWAVREAGPIPGAPAAVREARRHLALAVVSSSPRAVIDALLARIGVAELVEVRVGADMVARHKPHPDGFLLAAERLGVPPAACVVFEDSRAGLLAARAAGMASVAVLHAAAERDACAALADAACEHFDALPPGFWAGLAARGLR